MPAAKKGPNAKQEAGRTKKAENDAKKQAVTDQQKAAQEEAEWNKGANVKRLSKEEEASRKEEEAARKRREKAELLAAEEEAAPGTTAKAKKAVIAAKKTKKKDDLSFLEDALVSAADKKTKQKRAAEAAAKEKQEAEAKKKADAAAAPLDPLLANTEQMIGSIPDDDAEPMVGRKANKARMGAAGTSGIDAALGNLDISSGNKSARVTYADFEERMLPVVKAENPGLRLSQFKEKVYALWKKSPENPANQFPSNT
jgi:Coiled-coil domain-containing protein 124 /Oxs1